MESVVLEVRRLNKMPIESYLKYITLFLQEQNSGSYAPLLQTLTCYLKHHKRIGEITNLETLEKIVNNLRGLHSLIENNQVEKDANSFWQYANFLIGYAPYITIGLEKRVLQLLDNEITTYHKMIEGYQQKAKTMGSASPLKSYLQSLLGAYRKQKIIFDIMQQNIQKKKIEEVTEEYLLYLQKLASQRVEQEEHIKALLLI